MPRVCSVCRHPKRREIDEAAISAEPYRSIAKRFGTSPAALLRHKEAHLPASLVEAEAAKAVANADGLMGKIAALETEARRIGKKAEKAGDLRTALAGVRELTRIVELLARLLDAFPREDPRDPGRKTIIIVHGLNPGALRPPALRPPVGAGPDEKA